MAVTGATYPKTYRLTRRCFGITSSGVAKKCGMRSRLHYTRKCGNSPKKTKMDALVNHWLTSCEEYVQRQRRVQRILSLQKHQWHQTPSCCRYVGNAFLYALHPSKHYRWPRLNWDAQPQRRTIFAPNPSTLRKSPFCLTTAIILIKFGLHYKRCIRKSWRRFALSWLQSRPRQNGLCSSSNSLDYWALQCVDGTM